jgi:phage gp36-like protein
MPYCTLDDLKQNISEAELIQLTDDERLGAINEKRVNAIGVDVDDLIDGFLRGRYPLPLDPVPQIIRSIAKEMRIYKLFLRKKRQTITKEMTDNYNAQIKLLEKIQRGDITLGGETGGSAPEGPGPGEYKTNKTAADRKFGKGTLDQW